MNFHRHEIEQEICLLHEYVWAGMKYSGVQRGAAYGQKRF